MQACRRSCGFLPFISARFSSAEAVARSREPEGDAIQCYPWTQATAGASQLTGAEKKPTQAAPFC